MNTTKSPIKIEVFSAVIGNVSKRCVDARSLHSTLGNATAFSRWVGRRIEETGFTEGKDFLPILAKNEDKGRPATEYTITVEMAKHLCMMDRSDVGYQMRDYFIECEEKLIQINSLSVNQTSTLSRDLLKTIDRLKASDNQFEEQVCKELIERICLQLKMPQPPIELLDVKLEKKAS
ncbi:antA/AntB antirepressor family protein [Photobacterium galatheae]|uniref:AntA/AntB antirepressor domain-containing protein n=1 Tax=Photobacterium galatheae TaxID=1654360 RepID=A0A066RVG7_9GAMM|nr:antA/AntB antirepressor family protein [Photobacterium galatheae]KDM91383.1 hypothetical protein EA58_12550 [Photobacterium galatheae]MCM0151642.1 antA/AntB antirepressor family protein [Photobacterium galatheae]